MAEHDPDAIALPKLDEAQMAALGHCAGASLKHYTAGQKLIEVGQRDFKFFVVKSGEIEVVDESGEAPRTIAVLGRGEFTGDVGHLTGGPSLVSAFARTPCEVYEMSAEGVSVAVKSDSGSPASLKTLESTPNSLRATRGVT